MKVLMIVAVNPMLSLRREFSRREQARTEKRGEIAT